MCRPILTSLSGWAVVLILGFALFWACFSATFWGVVSALGLLSLAGLAVSVYLKFGNRGFWKTTSLSSLLLAAGVSFWLFQDIPTGESSAASPVSQRFSNAESFPRFHYANLVPETEQMNLGLALIPYLDRLMTHAKARRLKELTLAQYREMEMNPHFHALGSAMGGAYAEVLDLSYPEGHYYLYVPKSAGAKPLPCILFLHGTPETSMSTLGSGPVSPKNSDAW